MGWETRGNGRYFYRKRWRDGRCVSEYRGAGLLGLICSTLDAEDREEREEAEATRRAAREAFDAAEAEVVDYCRAVEDATRAALLAAGCHRHKGQWRRGRGMGKTFGVRVEMRPEERKLTPLMRRAQKGDEDALAELRRALPEEAFVRVAGGRAADVAVQAIVGRMIGDADPMMREGLRANVERIAREVAGPDASPLESLLAERVGVCWLDAYAADLCCARGEEDSLAVAGYHERRRDRAHRRFLTACKALATVRRLAGPGVAVSVEQNVTVHQAAPESPPAEGPALAELLAARGAN